MAKALTRCVRHTPSILLIESPMLRSVRMKLRSQRRNRPVFQQVEPLRDGQRQNGSGHDTEKWNVA